jgi:hypothetical protein
MAVNGFIADTGGMDGAAEKLAGGECQHVPADIFHEKRI